MHDSDPLSRMITILSFPGMRSISQSALTLMAERSRSCSFKKGEVLFQEGQPVESLYLILDGKVSISRKGRTYAQMSVSNVLGAISIFAEDSQGPQAVAETDVTALQFEGKDTAEIFQENFDLLTVGLQSMSYQMIQARLSAGPTAAFENEMCVLPSPRKSMTLADRLDYLTRSLTFAGDRLDALLEIARGCSEIRVGEKAPLWQKGDSQRYVVIPLSGGIKGWNETQSFHFAPGDCVGLLDALGGVPRWHSASSTTKLTALRFDVDTLLDVMEDHADLALRLLRDLAKSVLGIRKAA